MGSLRRRRLKNVQIEDLLNRSPINVENVAILNELKDKTILVSGAAGSIGSEIVRQITRYDFEELILIDHESALYDVQQELKQNGKSNFTAIVADIRDRNRMHTYFEKYRPNLVFHAAAYKHVPLMESNCYEAIKINVGGTKNFS